MCKHEFIKVFNCKVCVRCGLTRLPNGRIFIDKSIPNYGKEKKNGKK